MAHANASSLEVRLQGLGEGGRGGVGDHDVIGIPGLQVQLGGRDPERDPRGGTLKKHIARPPSCYHPPAPLPHFLLSPHIFRLIRLPLEQAFCRPDPHHRAPCIVVAVTVTSGKKGVVGGR